MNGANTTQISYRSKSLTLIAKTGAFVRTVFLSSSIKDLSKYRQQAQDALFKRAEVVCFKSEDWISSHGDVLQKCRDRINEADGYIGIFAYYYGSVLDGCQESVTHFEYKCANDRWGANERQRRIYILMPKEPKSRAQKDLMQRAFNELSCQEKKQREEHDKLLKLFHDEVKKGRTVNFFKDYSELREQVIVIGLQLKEIRPLEAAKGNVEVKEDIESDSKVSDEELGLLGRDEQLGGLRKIINLLPAFPDVPAVAFLISGNKNAGQEEFLKQIVRKKWISGRPTKMGRPQVEQYGVDELIQWVGDSLGVLVGGKEASNVEKLAALIHAELQNQQLSVVLDEIHRYVGDVAAFYETFWTPLFKELERLQAQKKTNNRLITVIADYSGKFSQWASIITKYGSGNLTQADYSKLFLLELTDITQIDILNWFDAVNIPFENRDYLMRIALKDIDGKPDGTPQEVFRKLRKQNLWNE